MRGNDRGNPAHVLKIQLARLTHNHVGRLHTINEQQPAVSMVAVGDQLRLTRRNRVHASGGTLHGGALGIVDTVLLLLLGFLRLLGLLGCPALFRHTH